MRQIKLKIGVGSGEDIAVVGDYVRVKSAGVPVRIESGDGAVDATIEEGDALNLKQFDRLRVSHDSGAEQEITLLIGNGTSADGSKVGGSLEVSSRASSYDQKNVVVNVASVLLLAANSARRFLLVQNNHSAFNLWLNLKGAAATTNGVKLPPGGSILLDSACPTGAIYAIGETAANMYVVVVEG